MNLQELFNVIDGCTDHGLLNVELRETCVTPRRIRHFLRSRLREIVAIALEPQQRYFSYRAMLVAIVSHNCLVLVFMGCRTIIARSVVTWGIAQMCLCEIKCKRGGNRAIWLLACLEKYRTLWGTAVIASHYRVIWANKVGAQN